MPQVDFPMKLSGGMTFITSHWDFGGERSEGTSEKTMVKLIVIHSVKLTMVNSDY